MLVEREAEREAIDAALAGARDGRGRFVLLYGQCGIGRSSLLRASMVAAEAGGAVVLDACGGELERGYGFGIVRQLLEPRIARLSPVERRSLLSQGGPAAESALGICPPELRVSSAGFDQIEAVHRLIGHLAMQAPLLLAVDDLQWCDRPSLDLLCFLGHRAAQLPVTVIAAWRRGEPGVKAGRLQALAGMSETLFLTPGPLSHAGVRAVLRGESGSDPGDEAVDAVWEQTGGQPFLVSELATGLRMRGVSMEAGCRSAIEALTPESVRRNIAGRLGRHPESVQRFARAVSVLVDGSIAHAAVLAGIDRDAARRATDALVRAGIFRDDSTVGFREPLLQRAVYGTLSALERAELHQHAAALLCDVIDAERAAGHLLSCEPAGEPRFADVLCRAAQHADGQDDARRYYVRALEELDEAEARAEVLLQVAELELRADDLPSAVARATEVLALAAAPAQRAAAGLICAEVAADDTDCRAAVELLEREALALEGDLELHLRATAATLRAWTGYAPAVTGFDDLPGESAAERGMLAACATQLVLTGGSAGRVVELCGRALSQASPGSGRPVLGADYLACRAAVLADAGDLVEGVLARQAAEPAPAVRALLALSRGELAPAAAAAREGLALLAVLSPTALRRRIRADLLATLVLAETERDQGEEAEHALAQLVELDGESRPTTICLQIARALARSEPIAELAARAEAAPEAVGLAGSARSWAALAHAAAGDQARAQDVAAAHLEFARTWGGPSVLGRALAVRGVVNAAADRIGFLEEAVAVLEHSPAQLELARAGVELGAALRRAGRRGTARAELMRGGDLAHRCGADALAARARAELVSTGARPRRAAFSGVGSLTVAEHRVAKLAAGGMTNREIAKELTVSVKTVSGQLGAIYLKLDVHDRFALAAAMQTAEQASAELEEVH